MEMQRVTWIDSCTHSGWGHYAKDDLTLAQCTSIGIRVPSHKGTVALAGSKGATGQLSDVMTIPRSCVKKIETLKVD
jgi:hypothetical protein